MPQALKLKLVDETGNPLGLKLVDESGKALGADSSAPPEPSVGTVDSTKLHAEAAKTGKAFEDAAPQPTTMDIVPNSPAVRGLKEFTSSIIGMGKGLFHSATDPATEEEKKTFGNQAGPIELFSKRTLIDPSVENFHKMLNAPNWQGALGYGLGTIPIAGPIGTHLGETAADKGLPEAVGEAGAIGVGGLLMHKLPGAVEGVTDKLTGRTPTPKAVQLEALKTKYPYAYTKSIEPMAEAFKVKSGDTRYMDFAENADLAMDEISKSSKELFGSNPTSNRAQIEAGQAAMKRIYSTEIGPKVGLIQSLDLNGLLAKLTAEIPDYFSPQERLKIERAFKQELSRSMSGVDAEALRQKLSAADRVLQADSNYVGAALNKTPKGYAFKAMDMGLRNYISDAVEKVQPGSNIRDALKRYGAVTDITQQAGGIPVDKSVTELLSGKAYITGTAPNLTGRLVEAAFKRWYANDNLVRRAYNKYTGPSPAPQPPPSTTPTTLAGTQHDLIPNAGGMTIPGIPPAGADPLSNFSSVESDAQPWHNQGNLFEAPMLEGQKIGQAATIGQELGRRMPQFGPDTPLAVQPFKPPVTAVELYKQPPTTVSAQPIRVNRGALYGNTPTSQRALTAGPYRFQISGDAVRQVMEGSAGETAAKLPPPIGTIQGASDSRLPAHYMEKNWQLDSTAHGQPLTETHQGPGTMASTDPKVAESTVAAIDKYLQKNPDIAKTKATALRAERDSLVKQLREYRSKEGGSKK